MSVDITERMLHLRQIPVAAILPTAILRLLAGAMRARTIRPGRSLAKQGTPVDALVLLTEGSVMLRRNDEPYGELRAPQTMGFLSILARTDAPWDATTLVESRAYEIETDTLLDLFADHFELVEATARYLAERLWFEFQELPAQMLGIPSVELGPIPARRVDIVERVLYLRKTSGFATANVNALAAMARQLEEVRFPAGTVIWKAGDPGDRVITLLEGSVRCEVPDGRAFTYGPGVGMGGVDSLADRPRWFSATAETPVVGLSGHSEDLLDLFEQQHRLAMDFIAMLSRAQAGLLERKAKLGENPLAVERNAKKLGSVRYGA